MQCPSCMRVCSHIYATQRPYGDDMVIRYRKCSSCGHKWKTQENEFGGVKIYKPRQQKQLF